MLLDGGIIIVIKKTEKNDEEKNNTINQLKIYDKYIVPLINVLDTRFNPFWHIIICNNKKINL